MCNCVALELQLGCWSTELTPQQSDQAMGHLANFSLLCLLSCAGSIIPVDIQEALNVTAPTSAPTAAAKASG